MDKRRFLSLAAGATLVGLTAACTTTGPGASPDPADTRRSIKRRSTRRLPSCTPRYRTRASW